MAYYEGETLKQRSERRPLEVDDAIDIATQVGLGLAEALNEESVASPRPQQGRPSAWAPSSVRSALYRELYRGVSVWNRSQQSDAWGQRAWKTRSESEWIQVDMPGLRIVRKPNRDEGLYEFSGRVTFDRLLNGVVFTRGMASPRGILPFTMRGAVMPKVA